MSQLASQSSPWNFCRDLGEERDDSTGITQLPGYGPCGGGEQSQHGESNQERRGIFEPLDPAIPEASVILGVPNYMDP